MTTLRDIYLKILTGAMVRQMGDGSMPSGHNGPYGDPETPVRNTSHYLIAFLRAWELSDKLDYYMAAEKCLAYLLGNNSYRKNHTFHHRTKKGKDLCNGLIGSAWNMEALLYAADKLNNQQARNLARELFLLHPFDAENCIWHRVEPDGQVLTVDGTFNHQLWFAACAAPLVTDTPEAADRITRFLDKLRDNWATAGNGRIVHSLWLKDRRRRERIKRIVKPKYRRSIILKEVGYHAFNLYAFALLADSPVAWPAGLRARVDRAVAYLHHPEYARLIDKSKYGFPYNPPGWEVPFALVLLGGQSPEQYLSWVKRQLAHSYDTENCRLSNGVEDDETHTARIYEAARLPDRFFDFALFDDEKSDIDP